MPLKERFSASERSSAPHLTLPRDPKVTGGMWLHEEPLVERLAQTASLKKPIPTAGWVGTQHAKEPNVEVPPECMLYEVDRKMFALGHIPPHRIIPQEALGSEDLEMLRTLALDDVKDARKFAKDQKKLVTPKVGKNKSKHTGAEGGVAAAGKSTKPHRSGVRVTVPATETAPTNGNPTTSADKRPGTPGTAVKDAYKAKSNK